MPSAALGKSAVTRPHLPVSSVEYPVHEPRERQRSAHSGLDPSGLTLASLHAPMLVADVSPGACAPLGSIQTPTPRSWNSSTAGGGGGVDLVVVIAAAFAVPVAVAATSVVVVVGTWAVSRGAVARARASAGWMAREAAVEVKEVEEGMRRRRPVRQNPRFPWAERGPSL